MAQRITARLHLLANRPRYLVFFFSLFPFSLPRLQLSFLIFVFFSYFTLLFSFPHNPLPKGYAFSKPSLTSSIDYGTYTRRAVTHKKHKNIPGDVTTTYVCLRTLKNTSLITGQAYLAILKPKKVVFATANGEIKIRREVEVKLDKGDWHMPVLSNGGTMDAICEGRPAMATP